MRFVVGLLVGLDVLLGAGQMRAQSVDPVVPVASPSDAKTLLEWRRAIDVAEPNEPEEEEPLVTDRPDFTESSTTVGRGRLQIETGYTYFHDRDHATRVRQHSYPELLCRIGLLREWFELRVGWNHATVHETGHPVVSGSLDLYLGAKLALTEQAGALPEMALLPQTFVPTGHHDFSGHELLPGINWLYSWEINEWLSLGGSSQANRTLDGAGQHHLTVAQSVTASYAFFERTGFFTEWFAFFPSGSVDPEAGPEHYFDFGTAVLLSNNLQLDARIGIGLNRHANDFFAGSGLAIRF